MDALFINRYYPSQKLFEAFYKKTSQKYSRIIGIAGLAVLAVGLFTLAWSGGADLFFLLMGIVGAALCLALIFFHKIMARSAMGRTLKLHGGKVFQTTVSFAERIVLEEGEETLTLDYSDIVDVVDCETVLALMFGKANGVIVKKDGFFKGDLKSFSAFLSKKLEG